MTTDRNTPKTPREERLRETLELTRETIIATLGCYVPGGWAHPGDEAAKDVDGILRALIAEALAEDPSPEVAPDPCVHGISPDSKCGECGIGLGVPGPTPESPSGEADVLRVAAAIVGMDCPTFPCGRHERQHNHDSHRSLYRKAVREIGALLDSALDSLRQERDRKATQLTDAEDDIDRLESERSSLRQKYERVRVAVRASNKALCQRNYQHDRKRLGRVLEQADRLVSEVSKIYPVSEYRWVKLDEWGRLERENSDLRQSLEAERQRAKTVMDEMRYWRSEAKRSVADLASVREALREVLEIGTGFDPRWVAVKAAARMALAAPLVPQDAPAEAPKGPRTAPTAHLSCHHCGKPYTSSAGGSEEIVFNERLWIHVECPPPPPGDADLEGMIDMTTTLLLLPPPSGISYREDRKAKLRAFALRVREMDALTGPHAFMLADVENRLSEAERKLAEVTRERDAPKETIADEVGVNLRIADRLGFAENIADGQAYEDAEIEAFERLTRERDTARAALAVAENDVEYLDAKAEQARRDTWEKAIAAQCPDYCAKGHPLRAKYGGGFWHPSIRLCMAGALHAARAEEERTPEQAEPSKGEQAEEKA